MLLVASCVLVGFRILYGARHVYYSNTVTLLGPEAT
jgi:hypothetical protein